MTGICKASASSPWRAAIVILSAPRDGAASVQLSGPGVGPPSTSGKALLNLNGSASSSSLRSEK